MFLYIGAISTYVWYFIYLKICFGLESTINTSFDPDIYRNASELISTKGYPVQVYEVQTEDGFILSLIRIPHGKNHEKSKDCKRTVVFLMHGLLVDSSCWVLNFPNQSLGFILADNCYDVWMGNTRGTEYSKRHITLEPNNKKYWDFSIDEFAAYDVPTMIDFVLSETKEDQLVYIGHSQGTTILFALLSSRPEYNKKVKLFIALSPILTAEHITSSVRELAPFASEIAFTFQMMGQSDLSIIISIGKYLSETVCSGKVQFLCKNIMFALSNFDSKQVNETRLPVYLNHMLGSVSIKTVLHYAQMIVSKIFRMYDYGRFGNLRHYSQILPPEYDVSKITTPLVLMYAENDVICDQRDVHALEKKLSNLLLSYRVPYEDFTHSDFFLAKDAYPLLHKKILSILR